MSHDIASLPAAINGDRVLSRAERVAYLAHHAARNAANARHSIAAEVSTFAGPGSVPFNHLWTPARHDAAAFFDWVGQLTLQRFPARDITVLDLGCGGGFVGERLASQGLVGRYVGVDLTPRKAWSTTTRFRGLATTFLASDVTTIDPDDIGPVDLIVSATALEHIEDDAGAIRHLTTLLAPDGIHAHFVPGEAALPLYGPHGWRQYSPWCLRQLFPSGRIYRYGGPGTNRLHAAAVTRPTALGHPDARTRHPRLYELAYRRARQADAASGWSDPSMYAVLSGLDSR